MAFLNKNQIIEIRERDRFTFFFFSFSNLVSFCFFARFTTDNVPKAGAKLGQKTKNQRHSHKNPSLKKKELSTKIQNIKQRLRLPAFVEF